MAYLLPCRICIVIHPTIRRLWLLDSHNSNYGVNHAPNHAPTFYVLDLFTLWTIPAWRQTYSELFTADSIIALRLAQLGSLPTLDSIYSYS